MFFPKEQYFDWMSLHTFKVTSCTRDLALHMSRRFRWRRERLVAFFASGHCYDTNRTWSVDPQLVPRTVNIHTYCQCQYSMHACIRFQTTMVLMFVKASTNPDNLLADGSQGTGLGWHADYPYHDIDTPWPPPEYPLGCQVICCATGSNCNTMTCIPALLCCV